MYIPIISRLGRLFRNLVSKGKVERDLADEVGSYVDLLTARKMKDGLDENEARRSATLELGGVEQIKEQVREVRIGFLLETRWQDLRLAARALRRSPVFSLTVVLVLALGIGSTALMFALVNSVLLQGAPFPEAPRLFMLWQDLPQEKRVWFSTREFRVWQKQSAVFENLTAMMGTGFTVTGRGEPELVVGQRVTTSFFPTLRTQPELGRAFLETEGKTGQDKVAILSHGFWREKFGMRREVLGESVVLNGEPHTIVGVMPERFDFPRRDVKLWLPAALDGPFFEENLDAHFLRVLGRLKPGATMEQLRAETAILGTRVNAPEDDTVRKFYATALNEVIAGDLRRPLLVLLGAVGFLLLIACANVANLMLARASAREGEMAVRRALGASRGRLIVQSLTEALLLAVGGGVLGAALAWWGLDLLKVFAAAHFPELVHAQMDAWSLGFIIALTVAAGLLIGLGPALSGSRADLQQALKGATRASSGARAERTRQALVFAEVALACVLLVGCGLMLRSFYALNQADPGFQPRAVLVADTTMMDEPYPAAPEMLRFYRGALAAVRALPGVEAAGVVTHLPFGGNGWGNGYEVEGQPAVPGAQPTAQIRAVSPNYFAALGIPLREGRDFNEQDNENAPGVAIVNQIFAARFWPDKTPIGQRIRYGRTWLSIVGVSGNIKHSGLDVESDAEIYVPYPQLPAAVVVFVGRQLNHVVRTSAPASVGPLLRGAIRQIDPGMVVEIKTMQSLIKDSIAQPRFRTWLIAIVSGFALVLAGLGIYGVIAYLVTQRSKEIGIRLALGATRRDILQLVLGRTLKLTGAGIAAGVVAAFFLSRFLARLLFGVTAHDLVTFLLVPLFLLSLALLAGYLPARRATRVNPVKSLRYE